MFLKPTGFGEMVDDIGPEWDYAIATGRHSVVRPGTAFSGGGPGSGGHGDVQVVHRVGDVAAAVANPTSPTNRGLQRVTEMHETLLEIVRDPVLAGAIVAPIMRREYRPERRGVAQATSDVVRRMLAMIDPRD